MKYFVIGLTLEDVANGVPHRFLELLHIASQKNQLTQIQVSQLKQAGVFGQYEVKKPLIEIRTVAALEGDAYRELVRLTGREFYNFVLFNETAMTVARAHSLEFPAVLQTLEESKLPPDIGGLLSMPYPELVRA
jgi:hypothetical protein